MPNQTRLILFLCISLILGMCMSPLAAKTDPDIPSSKRLRDILAENYPGEDIYVGGTTHGSLIGSISETILHREFSYITPSNDFKQSYVHPEPGIWQWELPDQWVKISADHGQVLRMHSPISPQCSKWTKADGRTPQELLINLEEYMTALCKRYNGYPQIKWMDVVNETVDPKTGEWFGPKEGTEKWENPWPIIGFDESVGLKPPLYIKRAFEIANRHAPNIKQIINQHGSMNPVAWEKIKELVAYLRDYGLRVDGIGFQAHVDVGWEKEERNLETLSELIDWAHANNLEFHVTENNVAIEERNEETLKAQADTFAAIVRMLVSKRSTGVVTWNLWHIRDGDGQKRKETPVLWFDDGSPKPAYFAVQEVLEQGSTN